MFHPNKNLEELEKLNGLVSLQDQVEEVRLQDKLGEQNFQYDAQKALEPRTDTNKSTSESLTKAITETFLKNNEALDNSNKKLPEIINDKGILTFYLLSPLI